MPATPSVDAATAIDQAPFGGAQKRIVFLCALIAMLDGFDTQVVAFVAPVLAAKWGLPVSAFGPVFGAGLAGLMFGALVFGPAADRFGRRRVIMATTAIFGVFTLLTPLADSLTTLLVLRLAHRPRPGRRDAQHHRVDGRVRTGAFTGDVDQPDVLRLPAGRRAGRLPGRADDSLPRMGVDVLARRCAALAAAARAVRLAARIDPAAGRARHSRRHAAATARPDPGRRARGAGAFQKRGAGRARHRA